MATRDPRRMLTGAICLLLLSSCAERESAQAGKDSDIAEEAAVLIKPGQAFSVLGVATAGKLTDLQLVDTVKGTKDALSFEFNRTPNGMMLKVNNSFGSIVKYKAVMKHAVRGHYYKTSICPMKCGPIPFRS